MLRSVIQVFLLIRVSLAQTYFLAARIDDFFGSFGTVFLTRDDDMFNIFWHVRNNGEICLDYHIKDLCLMRAIWENRTEEMVVSSFSASTEYSSGYYFSEYFNSTLKAVSTGDFEIFRKSDNRIVMSDKCLTFAKLGHLEPAVWRNCSQVHQYPETEFSGIQSRTISIYVDPLNSPGYLDNQWYRRTVIQPNFSNVNITLSANFKDRLMSALTSKFLSRDTEIIEIETSDWEHKQGIKELYFEMTNVENRFTNYDYNFNCMALAKALLNQSTFSGKDGEFVIVPKSGELIVVNLGGDIPGQNVKLTYKITQISNAWKNLPLILCLCLVLMF